MISKCFFIILLLSTIGLIAPFSHAAQPEKEWTFLSYMNGNNDLDGYGRDSIQQMERVGSSSKLNVVVQWASLKNGTRRLLIQKSANPGQVTSPVIENLGQVDMGDWRNLVSFLRWGMEHYPAKHYFVSIWSHGSGWHATPPREENSFSPFDISPDDRSGHVITTRELGLALREAALILGRPIDIYGSDACLMGMAEVASEVAESARYFVGSQQIIPTKSWPYESFFKQWTELKEPTPENVVQLLPPAYAAFYSRYWMSLTLSVLDLTKMGELHRSLQSLSRQIMQLNSDGRAKVFTAAQNRVHYTAPDYADLLDFVFALRKQGLEPLGEPLLSVENAVNHLVVANSVTYVKNQSHGVSFWLPTQKSEYHPYSSVYSELNFERETGWGEALRSFLVQ